MSQIMCMYIDRLMNSHIRLEKILMKGFKGKLC